MNEQSSQLPKTVIFVGIGLITYFVVYLVYTFFGHTLIELFSVIQTGDEEAIIAYLNSQSQFGGYLMLYFICILQVISVFFPGIIIQVSGALIYGWWQSFIICFLGFVSGNAIVFMIGKVFGKSLALLTSEHEKKDSWLIRKMNEGNPGFVVSLAFMVPGVPNGIIPYLAARTNLSLSQYVKAVSFSCWIQILLNCVAGYFIRSGDYMISIGTFALQILIIIIVTLNRDKILKK